MLAQRAVTVRIDPGNMIWLVISFARVVKFVGLHYIAEKKDEQFGLIKNC